MTDAAPPALAVVTTFTASLAAGDLDACRALVAADLVFSEAPNLPFGGDRTGPRGLADLLAAVSRDYRVRLAEPVVAALDDGPSGRVLVQVSGTIASRATGRSMPLDALDLYEVADGLITRVDVYYKDAAAVAALLDPAPHGQEPHGQAPHEPGDADG